MKLSEYIKNKQKPKTNSTFTSPEEAVSAYSKLSEEELLSELRRVAAGQREEGTLDAAQLESFYATLSPMLTPEQSAKMHHLIDEIKR